MAETLTEKVQQAIEAELEGSAWYEPSRWKEIAIRVTLDEAAKVASGYPAIGGATIAAAIRGLAHG
jgi:hypothetical protein